MAEVNTLHEAFVGELRDIYDGEQQITKALPRLIDAASDDSLRSAFEAHLTQTHEQIRRLERVFEALDEAVRGKRCDGMKGILEEGEAVLDESTTRRREMRAWSRPRSGWSTTRWPCTARSSPGLARWATTMRRTCCR